MTVPTGREGQDGSPCHGGVENGALWWPEEASKGDGVYAAAAATVAVASPESVVRLLVCRGSSRW